MSERSGDNDDTFEGDTLAGQGARSAPDANEFLANVDLEVRSPLNVIIGLTESLLRSELSSWQREQLQAVLESSEALFSVAQHILDLSRFTLGGLELQSAEFDIHEMLAGAIEPLAAQAHARGIDLVPSIDPELPRRLIGDPERLKHVVSNLVADAMQRVDRGEIPVRVLLGSDPGRGLAARFCVIESPSETSAPAPAPTPAEPEREPAGSWGHGGNRLELALTDKLVALMGGELHSGTEPDGNRSTHFVARLAAAPFEAEPSARAHESLAGMRVLIVDDGPAQRRSLEQLLGSAGMRPTCVAPPEDAFSQLEASLGQDPFRLLVVDVELPETHGFSLVQRIRRDSRLYDLEAVFLTPPGPGAGLERWDSLLGAKLRKPFRQDELLKLIGRRLGPSVRESGTPVSVQESAGGEALPGLRLSLGDGQEVQLQDDGREVHVPHKRILLLEDSIASQKVVQAILRDQHTVVVARTGNKALELIDEQNFDVALLDVEMPGMNGLEVAQAIRAGEAARGGHLPLIAVTAHALDGDRERCIEAGMDDYVAKPVRRETLLQAITDAVGFEEIRPGSRAAGGLDRLQQGLLDWTGPRSKVGTDQGKLRALAEESLGEIREHLGHLHDDVAAQQAESLRRRAEGLKAVARLFGAIEPYRLAANLEEVLGENGSASVEGLVRRLEDSFAPVIGELSGFLGGAPGRHEPSAH